MSPATPARYRKLAVIGGVLLVHAALLWWVQSGPDRPPVEDVVALQLVSQWGSAQPAQATPELLAMAKPPGQAAAPQARTQTMQSTNTAPVSTLMITNTASAAPSAPPVAAAATAAATAPAIAAGQGTSSAGMATDSGTGAQTSNTLSNNPAASAPRVELPSSDADYLHNPKPEYPRLSRQRNEQGKVVVNVLIGVDGIAQKAELKTSSGFERLDQAALTTAKAWRYVPGKRGGVPEAMWFAVPINFVME